MNQLPGQSAMNTGPSSSSLEMFRLGSEGSKHGLTLGQVKGIGHTGLLLHRRFSTGYAFKRLPRMRQNPFTVSRVWHW